MRTVFVIMPSYLGAYQSAAKNREGKFLRAVNSFLANDYKNKKLIIVADGCEITQKLYEKYYSTNNAILLLPIPKQDIFSGIVRQAGIESVNINGKPTDIICYLDTDDEIMPSHLTNIVRYFNDNEFVYFNDYWYFNKNDIRLQNTQLEYGKIGTSCIAHLNKPEYNWIGCDGYGHDFIFIQKLLSLTDKYAKIRGCGYLIHHISGIVDN